MLQNLHFIYLIVRVKSFLEFNANIFKIHKIENKTQNILFYK